MLFLYCTQYCSHSIKPRTWPHSKAQHCFSSKRQYPPPPQLILALIRCHKSALFMQTARHLLNSREILSISRALRALLNVQRDQNILQKESTDLSANNLMLALGGFHERCFAVKKPPLLLFSTYSSVTGLILFRRFPLLSASLAQYVNFTPSLTLFQTSRTGPGDAHN